MVPALGRAALTATVAALAALAATLATTFVSTTDSLHVLQGASVMIKCFQGGNLPHCDSDIWYISHFPLAQYIPAAILNPLGVGGDEALHALAWLSFLCLLGVLAVTWQVVTPRGGRAVAAMAVLAVLVGSSAAYAASAFGEMLAAFLTVLFAAALITRERAWIVALTFALAGITKDVAVPLLVVLAAAILAPSWRNTDRDERRRTLIALGAGAIAAIALTAGFNWFRYASLTNGFYSAVPHNGLVLGTWPRNFFAALFSPNAGVVFQWPVVAALFVYAAVRRVWQPLARLLVVLAAFSAYYWPFGWYAWMNRLSVAWIPALVIVAAAVYPAPIRDAIDALRAPARAAVACLLVVVLALAHAGPVSAGRERTFGWLFTPDRECPVPLSMMNPFSAKFRDCELHNAWDKPPVLVKGIGTAFERDGIPLALTAALASLLLLLYARRVSPESDLRP
jgi:hypothetical protein